MILLTIMSNVNFLYNWFSNIKYRHKIKGFHHLSKHTLQLKKMLAKLINKSWNNASSVNIDQPALSCKKSKVCCTMNKSSTFFRGYMISVWHIVISCLRLLCHYPCVLFLPLTNTEFDHLNQINLYYIYHWKY